jgi:hypothetical protein
MAPPAVYMKDFGQEYLLARVLWDGLPARRTAPSREADAWYHSAMRHTARLLLLSEAICFGAASLVHRGILVSGYQHPAAAEAEGAIGLMLLACYILTWAWPAHTRAIALAGQGAALLGTLVGALTVAVGIGPHTALDIAFHVAMLALLAFGLVATARSAAPVAA